MTHHRKVALMGPTTTETPDLRVVDLGEQITKEFYQELDKKQEQEGPPRLPPDAYHGVLGDYVELMGPTTEAPPEFHFGALATVLAALFSDRYLRHGTELIHPNLFSVLAGSTGVSHKTTAVNAAIDLVWKFTEEGDTLRVLRDLGSREGLLNALPDKGEPVLWRVSEYTGLVKKGAANSATGTLVELQLQLFDRPRKIENHTLSNPITVNKPNVTMLGDSTEEFLTETFSDAVLSNGILNRLSLWLGRRGGPIAFPANVDTADQNRLVKALSDAFRESVRVGGEVGVSAEAQDYWKDLYAEEIFPRQGGPDGSVLGRLQVFPWKSALLYAVLDSRQEISREDLERGWAVSRYLGDCALRVASRIGTSEQGQLLDEILKVVQKGGGLSSPGYLARKLSQKWRHCLDKYGGAQKNLTQLVRDGRLEQNPEDGMYSLARL